MSAKKRPLRREIIDRLPLETEDFAVSLPHGEVLIRRFQIMVWASLSVDGDRSRPFPAVLDTGLNHNFALNESCLHWTNLRLEQLKRIGTTRIDNEAIPIRMATVHLHRNLRGSRTIAAKEPYELNTPEGIVVFPAASKYPRIPLLGIRCLVNSNLRLVIDGKRRLVSIGIGWC